jgi:hypothetical protein
MSDAHACQSFDVSRVKRLADLRDAGHCFAQPPHLHTPAATSCQQHTNGRQMLHNEEGSSITEMGPTCKSFDTYTCVMLATAYAQHPTTRLQLQTCQQHIPANITSMACSCHATKAFRSDHTAMKPHLQVVSHVYVCDAGHCLCTTPHYLTATTGC